MIQINDKTYNIIKTHHLTDKRNNGLARNAYISDEYLDKILYIALRNGLTSFRDKGHVRLMFEDFQGIQYGVLVNLSENKLTVITIFRDTDKTYNSFIKVQNQVNLFRVFTLPEESYIDYQNDEINDNFIYTVSKNQKNPKLKGLKKITKGKARLRKSTDRYDIDDSMSNYKDLISF